MQIMQFARKQTESVAVLEAPGILERRARQSGRIQDRSGGRLNPLALSRFLRRGMAPACKNRSAAPLTARLFLPQAAPRRSCPEKALCNSSHALLHAFSASRLERLLLLGPGGPRSARPVLLRLAGFRKRGLARSAKIGALRQPHLRCLVHRTRSTRLPWSSRVGRESRGGRAGPSKVPPSPSGPSGQRPEADAF